MAVARFSRLAAADLLSVGAHTLERWGEGQAIRYLDDLEACCQMLAERPSAGRACNEVRPGLRRMERGSHVIFYRPINGGIMVARILPERLQPDWHERMLPDRHSLDDV